MIRRYPDSAALIWSLGALVPVAAWFLLSARLAILRGADITASADIAFAALVTAQAFIIPLFASGATARDWNGTAVAAACPVYAGLPFAALFWLAGTLTAAKVISAQLLLTGFAGCCVLTSMLVGALLPPRVARSAIRLVCGLTATAAVLFSPVWTGWIA